MDENLGDVSNDRISSITGCGLDEYYSKNALVPVLQRYLSESLVKSIVQELDGFSLTLPVIPTLTLSQSMRLVNDDVFKIFLKISDNVGMLREIYTVEGSEGDERAKWVRDLLQALLAIFPSEVAKIEELGNALDESDRSQKFEEIVREISLLIEEIRSTLEGLPDDVFDKIQDYLDDPFSKRIDASNLLGLIDALLRRLYLNGDSSIPNLDYLDPGTMKFILECIKHLRTIVPYTELATPTKVQAFIHGPDILKTAE